MFKRNSNIRIVLPEQDYERMGFDPALDDLRKIEEEIATLRRFRNRVLIPACIAAFVLFFYLLYLNVSAKTDKLESIREAVNDYGYASFEIIGDTDIPGGRLVYVRGLDDDYRVDLVTLVCNDEPECHPVELVQSRIDSFYTPVFAAYGEQRMSEDLNNLELGGGYNLNDPNHASFEIRDGKVLGSFIVGYDDAFGQSFHSYETAKQTLEHFKADHQLAIEQIDSLLAQLDQIYPYVGELWAVAFVGRYRYERFKQAELLGMVDYFLVETSKYVDAERAVQRRFHEKIYMVGSGLSVVSYRGGFTSHEEAYAWAETQIVRDSEGNIVEWKNAEN